MKQALVQVRWSPDLLQQKKGFIFPISHNPTPGLLIISCPNSNSSLSNNDPYNVVTQIPTKLVFNVNFSIWNSELSTLDKYASLRFKWFFIDSNIREDWGYSTILHNNDISRTQTYSNENNRFKKLSS